MCFSNLPVEFDENGDPYLADEADEVTRPGACDHDHDQAAVPSDCSCAETGDVPLDEAPADAFEEILESVPETTRSHLGDATDPDAPDTARRQDSVEGD